MKEAHMAVSISLTGARSVRAAWFFLITLCSFSVGSRSWAAPAPKPATGARDTLVFENGDTLKGKLEREVTGTIFFNSDELGEVNVPWSKVRTLRTQGGYVVLENKPGVHHSVVDAARGTLRVEEGEVHVSPGTPPPSEAKGHEMVRGERIVAGREPIPVAQAQFILDDQTFNKQVRENPNFFAGWNGSATVGITVVKGTENQQVYTSAVAITRSVPTVSWLATRNRTSADFSSSYGQITQPAYLSGGVPVAAVSTRTSIFHADAERDEYVSTRAYLLAQTAFDHNYSQGLDLQQIYGAGVGLTVLKRPVQQLDLRASLQYEKQVFLEGVAGTNQNLIGSTLSGTYALRLKRGIAFNQQASYLPAFNNTRAYTANETNALSFPVYKNLAFTVGTIDTYLNDPPVALPPVTRNSFQFTTGVTYNLKSKY